MKPTKAQIKAAIDNLFSDEDRLARKLRQLDEIDLDGGIAFVNWLIANNWRLESPGRYVNTISGENKTREEIKALFNTLCK